MSLRDGVASFFDSARAWFLGLPERDRALLLLLVAVFSGGGLWAAHGAMAKARKQATARLSAASYAQAQVDALLVEYNELAGKAEALDARLAAGAGFTPLSWLEDVGRQMNISDNLKSLQERGSESTDWYKANKIQVSLDDIDLRQTVDFLYRLEQAPQAIRVQELSVRAERNDRTKLDVKADLAVLVPPEGV